MSKNTTTATRLSALESRFDRLEALLVASLEGKSPAKVTSKKATAKKAVQEKAPVRTTKVVENHGQKRRLTFEGGRIVANEPVGKKAKARAAQKAAEKAAAPKYLCKPNRDAYLKAALKQDPEYLEAVQEFHGFTGRNPSVREMASYALDVELEVPGFAIGEGYRNLLGA